MCRPILSEDGAAAKITVGPFIMVDKQDFIDCELEEAARLTGDTLQKPPRRWERCPLCAPKVNHLSTLLFMAVGFMNNVYQENRMLQSRRSDAIQGQITAYILTLKQQKGSGHYPFELAPPAAKFAKPEPGREPDINKRGLFCSPTAGRSTG